MSLAARPRAVTIAEFDMPRCALRYGETTGAGTCPAVQGVDSDFKCFNTLATCPVPNFYLEDNPLTLLFAKNRNDLPRNLDCIPILIDVDFTPSVVSLGRSLGQRESVQVTMRDRPHSDSGGLDPYLADRAYDPYRQGTFFGKFRARSPYLRGHALRIRHGFIGQALGDMPTRHYLVDSFDGPSPDGSYTLTGKDPLKALDNERSLAPATSSGYLLADLAAGATSATLSPAGIGDDEYDAGGHINIGGTEIVAFARTGDVLTMTRGQFNTEDVDHDAGDRVQQCLYLPAKDPADIVYTLMTTFAGVDSAYIDFANWLAETAAYLGNVYTGLIAEPTGVKDLVEEIIEQAALAIWWDPINEQIRLRVLRAISTEAALYDEDKYIRGSLEISEQPDLRVSQVWTYFAQINPLSDLDSLDNYRSTEVTIDLEAEARYGSASIKRILSRWIPQGGRAVVQRMNSKHIARYTNPPRSVAFKLMRSTPAVPRIDPVLGEGYRLGGWSLQDQFGASSPIPIQVTAIKADAARLTIEAEEALFVDDDGGAVSADHVIIIDSDSFNLNWRTLHDALYGEPEAGDVVTLTIAAGVTVGSTSIDLPAFDVGFWPPLVVASLTLIVNGRIEGKGGNGGVPSGFVPGDSPLPQHGGPALVTGVPIFLEVGSGEIWGGGGGGAGAQFGAYLGGGGGGAGSQPGSGGTGSSNGSAGTATAGGAGAALAGAGGGPGLFGVASTSSATTGAPGNAIDGAAFVLITVGPGDVRGGVV